MKRIFLFPFLLCLLCFHSNAHAFCGFYVAKASADLFNNASKVIMARAEDRTVITMANDFQGEVKDFAIVVPVPDVISEGQVNVADPKLIDHLDAYTAPRLVEYFDSNPCMKMRTMMETAMPMASIQGMGASRDERAAALGVTIEEEYTVGEYDIVVLSAEQSDGLLTFLNSEGYKLPEGAEDILGSYIKQDMKFFLAKVNIEEFESRGYAYLRPLQVAFESDKFMLPIRLGTLNARGPQDLILMTLTREGRVEPTNYRTVKIPTDIDLPLYVENEFDAFYRAMFSTAVKKEDMKAVFLEYAWDMSWCDPCAADPLSRQELRTLGAWWVEEQLDGPARPMQGGAMPTIMPSRGGPVNAYVTRMHVRYTAETFPEDLILQETGDTENFQGRYILRHPWKGEAQCEAAGKYFRKLPQRFDKEAENLARLTGWDIKEIREKMEKTGQSFDGKVPVDDRPWWEKIWNREEN